MPNENGDPNVFVRRRLPAAKPASAQLPTQLFAEFGALPALPAAPTQLHSPGGTAVTAYDCFTPQPSHRGVDHYRGLVPPAPLAELGRGHLPDVRLYSGTAASSARGGGTLRDQLLGRVQPLLDAVHRLHAAGIEETGISLPRIVVVGEQSSGKSSLLEALIGYDILPTGSGTVTRRPLYLRLVSTQTGSRDGSPASDASGGSRGSMAAEAEPRARVGENASALQPVASLAELKATILAMTNAVAGVNAGISPAPLYVELAGPRCPELTLVDLPGLVKNPLPGSDQPADIEARTLELVQLYGASPMSILIAVVPATIDPATSDAIRACRRLDPTGERTLGVLTKLDLLDGSGNSAADVLATNPFRFGLGVVGTRNRSAADMVGGVTVAAARAREDAYFETHSEYSQLPRDQLGAGALATRLGQTLAARVAAAVPAIWRALDERSAELNDALAQLASPGRPSPDARRRPTDESGGIDGAAARAAVSERVAAFAAHFNDALLGRACTALSLRRQPPARSDVGLATVLRAFHALGERVNCDHRIGDALADDEIEQTLAGSHGASVPGFDSFDAFQALVMRQHALLRAPALRCVEEVSEHLRGTLVAQALAAAGAQAYPGLAEALTAAAKGALADATSDARRAVHQLVDQLGFVYTNDSAYSAQALAAELQSLPTSGGGGSILCVLLGDPATRMTARRVAQMRAKLVAYDSLVRAQLSDAVPRCVGWHLMHRLQATLMPELQRRVVDGRTASQLDDLLQEHEHISRFKAGVVRELAIIEEAAATLRALDIPRPPAEPLSTPLSRRAMQSAARARRDTAGASRLGSPLSMLTGSAARSPPAAHVDRTGARARASGAGRQGHSEQTPRLSSRLGLAIAAVAGAALAFGAAGMLQLDFYSLGM
ncbi:P-loop containing nucleoside triphosphate hydrolase protein [Pavlovales sp. CCMP2436]|nr:P-loop containing nucleoside triphosphate hydrolase protein [Pavlovales sp. CCMP2436]